MEFRIVAAGAGSGAVDDVELFEESATQPEQLGSSGVMDFHACGDGFLMRRIGQTLFYITDNRNGERLEVDPAQFLTPNQLNSMDSRTDMILQFVGYLEELLAEKGLTDVSITATTYVSLNGRDPQLLFDPELDLTKKERTPWHEPWIAPLTEPLRPTGTSR